MRKQILEYLQEITEEEQELLDTGKSIRKELYTSDDSFIIESEKLLQEGKLIDIRRHTRFAPFPPHRHDYIEMIYVVQGSLTHIVNGKDVICQNAGDLLFLNQHATHEIKPAGKDDLAVNFIILPEFFSRPLSMTQRQDLLRDFLISSVVEKSTSAAYLHVRAGGVLPVENLMENMIFTLLDAPASTNTVIQETMGLLFVNLSMYCDLVSRESTDQDDRHLLFSVIKYIESHYKDGTLSQVAQENGYPAYFVSRVLKKHTGSNFKQLLQTRKLQQAAYLLENSTLAVDFILEEIGYENSSYFYRKFKEQYNCSPNEYRTAHSKLH
ncbi:MAG: AraC family transcriptional regulator [Lachnospiraceae bacterium]|nr:AraC family transcriptional regulator [Lachnospiraceae bacterium]